MKKEILLLGLILLLAITLRLAAWNHLGDYSFDELISVKISEKPISEMWNYLKYEMHPPLHFLYLHGWIKIFGDSEKSVRMSSFVLSIFTVFFIYLLGKEIFNSVRAGLYAGLIAALSSFQALYSVWGRMYALLFFAATLSFYSFIKALKNEDDNQKIKTCFWILYFLSTLSCLYIHLTALIIPVIQTAYVFYLHHQKKLDKRMRNKFIISGAGFIILFSPWLINFIFLHLNLANGQAWYFWYEKDNIFVISTWLKLLIAGYDSIFIETISLLFFSGLVILSFFSIRKKDESWIITSRFSSGLVYALLIFIFSTAWIMALSLYTLRFYMLPAIGLYLIIGSGLAHISLRPRHETVLVLVLLAIFFTPLANIMKMPTEEWSQVGNFIQEREKKGDVIISSLYCHLLPIDHYYHGQLASQAILTGQISNDSLLNIIKTNIYPTADKDNIGELERLTQDKQRVFLVLTDQYKPIQEMVQDWFMSHGWRLKEMKKINSLINQQILLLQRT